MKILKINCSPDLSYFTKRGVEFEVDTHVATEKFPIKFLYKVKDANGNFLDMYTPDASKYVARFTGYDVILVGWKPEDYGQELKNTGGYMCPQPVNDQYWLTVRQDGKPYAIHEMMHAICYILAFKHKLYATIRDFMDSDRLGRPYFLNDFPEAIDSNFSQTWATIAPHINLLNKKPTIIQSIKQVIRTKIENTVVITRYKSNVKETLGELVATNGKATFTCKTLELPDFGNTPNISCIPKGKYFVTKVFWKKRLRWAYLLQNVKDRQGIFIHEGNYYYNYLGCIGLGQTTRDLNGDGFLDITDTVKTVKLFEQFMENKPFMLIIQ